MKARESILVVLGMHRSGTSFLTHCTEVLGFQLPGDRGEPAPDNPKGHFEPRAIVDVNEAALAKEGALWARIAPVRNGPAPADMAGALRLSYGDAQRIVIKDPRMSLLMHDWRPCLEDLGPTGVLIALRHPAEVAASLARRDSMLPDLAYLSWISYTLTALETTEGMLRRLVLFPDWTDNIEETLNRIASVAGVVVPDGAAAQVMARFDSNAVHGGHQITAANPDIRQLATDLFEHLRNYAHTEIVPEPHEIIPFRMRFTAVSEGARAVELNAAGEITKLNITAIQSAADNLSLQKQLTETRNEGQKLIAQRDDMIAQLGHLTQLLQRERMTILKPAYRRLHRFGGKILRAVLPEFAFDRLKRFLPYPGNIPNYLAYSPAPAPIGKPLSYIEMAPPVSQKPDIFVMSIIDWEFRTQRPQHLSREFAKAGHRVFYIEMKSDSGNGSAYEVAPNLYVIRLSSRGMRGVRPYSGTVSPNSIRSWVNQFYQLTEQISTTRHAHIVVEHPYWWNFVRHLASQFQITFDCMDEIAGFSNTEQAILDLEADMVRKADKMTVSSQYLYDKYASQRHIALIRNGTDVGHFIHDDIKDIPDFLVGKLRENTIRVGYVGAIAEWFDAGLISDIARTNPDFDIHLCGTVTAEEPAHLGNQPNITLHGEIRYADVPAFLMAMDVLIIPFRLLPIIKACDPVKFYEYSAVKKPTVSTALPELERAGGLVTIAHDAAGFAEGIRSAAALSQNPDTGEKLRTYALENAWSYRAADMLAEMEQAPLISVIILSYGPADLTLECLNSLIGSGEVYPALEILIVDNGSSPDELARLRKACSEDDRIQLIENDDNLGFAKGNNVGIEIAKGEYVLLLNNDTYVAAGAISAMVRHLERNPQIGIAGPLTNNIGNEARVDVSYHNMAEMELIARDLVTGYRGNFTRIPVCAYFCTMFRKADLNRIGHLPTVYGRGMFEDDDHCASFRSNGMITALAEDAFVHHHLSATFGQLPSEEKRALFERNKKIFESRWGTWTPHRYRDSRPSPSLPEQ